jgi:hypothetical protein
VTTPSYEDLFDGPGSTSAIKFSDHEGQLALIWARAQRQHTYDDETKDVIEADVVILDPPNSGPIKYANTIIFPRMLQGQIRRNIGTGKPNLGRIGKGEAKPRQTAPWVLLDPTEADKKLAVGYLQNPDAKPAPVSAATGGSWQGEEPPF